jgi:hypothetical protein
MPPAQTHRQAELSSRFVSVRAALCSEAPDALDRLAALAVQALADGDLPLAAASAGTAVLAEHLQSAIYRHAPRMLGVLAAAGPDSAAVAADGLLAWAGAAVAHDYGVLPSWPRPDIATLMERAQQAATDTVLALAARWAKCVSAAAQMPNSPRCTPRSQRSRCSPAPRRSGEAIGPSCVRGTWSRLPNRKRPCSAWSSLRRWPHRIVCMAWLPPRPCSARD